jgi:hypothetical protein
MVRCALDILTWFVTQADGRLEDVLNLSHVFLDEQLLEKVSGLVLRKTGLTGKSLNFLVRWMAVL